jgi:aspartyl-tRNA(Asn)/glutamyl-tRNA(Gln) amidotransferase subunit B
MTADQLALDGKTLGKLIKLVIDGKVSRPNAKKILAEMFENDIDPESYANEQGYIVSNDTGAIEGVIRAVVMADERSVNDYKSGKEKALMALFGKCMKELKGNCDPQSLRQMLIDVINSI